MAAYGQEQEDNESEEGEELVANGENQDEEEYEEDMDAWDEVKGGNLPTELVKKARLEELPSVPFYTRLPDFLQVLQHKV